ncbi:hypothetical protein [Palleronia sp. LCG004]|uniref:hypothetical protein n=1 Tax=Palleronia sp. LCG004 TaxID=3079304 RepID=UPI002943DAAF|nr:hypothetical protein [Palleronia sp. LCG004]WOI56711.1 hypothetical protein RVY76_02615 [Palleronia sp. LCG004]
MAGFLFKDREYSTPIQFTIDLFGAVVAIWAVLQIGIFIEPKVLLGAQVLQYLLPAVALAVVLIHMGLRALRIGRALRSGLRLPRWRITGRLAILWAGLFPATWAERSADRVFRGEWHYLAALTFCISGFYGFASVNISDRLDVQQIAQEEIGQRGMRFSTESYRNAFYFQNAKSLDLFHEAFGVDQDRMRWDMFELTLSRPAPFTGRPMLHELIDRADCDDLAEDATLTADQSRRRCDARVDAFLDIFDAEVRRGPPWHAAALGWIGIARAEREEPEALKYLDPGALDFRFALLNERGASDFDWDGEAGNFDGDSEAQRLAVSVLAHALSRRAGHLSARLAQDYGLTLDADGLLPAGAAPPDTPDFDELHNLAVADPLTALQILHERNGRVTAARLAWTVEELDAMYAAICAATPGRVAHFAARAAGPVRDCDLSRADPQIGPRALGGWTAALVLEPLDDEPDTMLAHWGRLTSLVDDGTTRSARIRGLGAVALRDERLLWVPEDAELPLIAAVGTRPGLFAGQGHIFLLHDGAATAAIKLKKGGKGAASFEIVPPLQEVTAAIPTDLLELRLPLQVRARAEGAEVLLGVSGATSDAPFRMRSMAENWRDIPIPPGAKQVTLVVLVPKGGARDTVLSFSIEEKTGLTCRPGPAGLVGPGIESETRLMPEADALGACRFAVREAVDTEFEASGFAPLDVDYSILRTGPYKPGSTDCTTLAEAGATESVLTAFGVEDDVERVSGALDPGCYAVEWNTAAAEVAAPFTMRIAATATVPGATSGSAIPIAQSGRFEMNRGDPLADRAEMWVDVSDVSRPARIVVEGFEGDIDLTVFDADNVEIDRALSVETPEILETDLTDATRIKVTQVAGEPAALGAFTLRID